jgi:DNA-binding HxlR family transcriptional regulator
MVGERWAMLIMRELMFGPRRFTDLRRDLPGISANVLSERLSGLEDRGIVRRRQLPPPANAQVYELTEWGLDADPLIRGLGRWAMRHPDYEASLPLSAASMMMSLRTTFHPERADRDLRVGVRTGERSFVVEVRNRVLTVEQQPVGSAAVEVTVAAEPSALARLLYGHAPVREMEASGVVSVHGDRRVLARFSRWFDLPEKVRQPD